MRRDNEERVPYEGKIQDVVSMSILETQYDQISFFSSSQKKQKVSA
jgi:hypothetical protein